MRFTRVLTTAATLALALKSLPSTSAAPIPASSPSQAANNTTHTASVGHSHSSTSTSTPLTSPAATAATAASAASAATAATAAGSIANSTTHSTSAAQATATHAGEGEGQSDLNLPIIVQENDPLFFDAPAGYESKDNGAVLKSREIDVVFKGSDAKVDRAYQLLYKSFNPVSNKAFATPLTILIPPNVDADHVQKNILVHQVPYDSINPACAPSRKIGQDLTIDASQPGSEQSYAKALKQGLTVVLSDYEGSGGFFAINSIQGNAILDAVRATRSFGRVVSDPSKMRAVLEGYSGGAIGTGGAVERLATYAPELQTVIQGATLGGLASNLSSVFLHVDKTPQEALAVLAMASFYNAFDSIESWLKEYLNVQGHATFSLFKDICPVDLMQLLAKIFEGIKVPTSKDTTGFFETFTNGLTQESGMMAPAFQNVVDLLLLGKTGTPPPPIPVYIYSGERDETIPHSDSVHYFERICDAGVKSAHLLEVKKGSHADIFKQFQSTTARDFLLDRLAGKPATDGCTRSTS